MEKDLKDKIEIVQGDITKMEVDAIINAANTSLLGGGGVDGAIHRAAGPELLAETKTIGGCPTGEARVTNGYQLPAKWVIHTVGPIWSGGYGDKDELLANCYINSFKAALEISAITVAFPSISTGVYRFPLERAVNIALRETKFFLQNNQSIKKVIFVCFGSDVYKKYQEVFNEVFNQETH